MSSIADDRDDSVLSDAEVLELSSDLPTWRHFPDLDELIAGLDEIRLRHPDLVAVERIGTSRLGEDILVYTVSVDPVQDSSAAAEPVNGEPVNGLIVGGVHPNEPIGSVTILHLVDMLVRNDALRRRLRTRWHIVACADPDGMRLNHEWYDRPGDAEAYFRGFYRPPGPEQVEWTFPINYKTKQFDSMLPETAALKGLIDRVRPDFYVPLHNAEGGGAYYYLSPALAPMIPLLHALPQRAGIPLHHGHPESPMSEVLAPGVFSAIGAEDAYDWRADRGLDPIVAPHEGQSSTSYARRYGTTALIAELPLWTRDGADDQSASEANYGELLREAGAALQTTGGWLEMILDRVRPHLHDPDEPIMRSALGFIPMMTRVGRDLEARGESASSDRLARAAERPMGVVWMFRLRYGGALLRALTIERERGDDASGQIAEAVRVLDEEFSSWLVGRDREMRNRSLPIDAVASVQLGAILGLASYHRSRQLRRDRCSRGG
ncbi:M14 family zinc carboxypeptidase [Brevibacterium oceani]|uniref:M14 family zinc carboxypeptidase n=1 Tax=Brevibacterium oceani TaxID=358099 RepID=UPI0015E74D56|nr:M14 family zinc carboxypeptidase [Brevibacterium oceani]